MDYKKELELIEKQIESGELSDGYHSFNELYELCYYEHPEKYERNTIENPACKKFKEVI
jgi:hypothetical protein